MLCTLMGMERKQIKFIFFRVMKQVWANRFLWAGSLDCVTGLLIIQQMSFFSITEVLGSWKRGCSLHCKEETTGSSVCCLIQQRDVTVIWPSVRRYTSSQSCVLEPRTELLPGEISETSPWHAPTSHRCWATEKEEQMSSWLLMVGSREGLCWCFADKTELEEAQDKETCSWRGKEGQDVIHSGRLGMALNSRLAQSTRGLFV